MQSHEQKHLWDEGKDDWRSVAELKQVLVGWAGTANRRYKFICAMTIDWDLRMGQQLIKGGQSKHSFVGILYHVQILERNMGIECKQG